MQILHLVFFNISNCDSVVGTAVMMPSFIFVQRLGSPVSINNADCPGAEIHWFDDWQFLVD